MTYTVSFRGVHKNQSSRKYKIEISIIFKITTEILKENTN